jgi:hypothetical protein
VKCVFRVRFGGIECLGPATVLPSTPRSTGAPRTLPKPPGLLPIASTTTAAIMRAWIDAAAGGCERQPRDGFASSSFDNRDGLHATFGGCRAPPRHTQDRFGVYGGGSRGDAAPGTPAGCTPLGRDAVGTAEKPAGKTGSSVSGKPFPPKFVSGPTFRKSE